MEQDFYRSDAVGLDMTAVTHSWTTHDANDPHAAVQLLAS